MPCVNDMSPMDVVVKRCKVSMVLFKPFRAPTDLLCDFDNDNAWADAYSAWEPTRSEFVKEIMSNMEDYFDAQEKAIAVAEIWDSDGVSDDELGNVDEIDALTGAVDFSEMPDACLSPGDAGLVDPDHLWASGTIPDTDMLNPAIYPSAQQQCEVIDVIIQNNLLLSSAQFTADKSRDIQRSVQVGDALDSDSGSITLEELRGWVNSDATDDDLVQENRHEVEQPIEVIELLSETLRPENMEWRPNERCPVSERVEPYASLQSISRAKSLNERQHIVFCIAGKALLKRFYEQELVKETGHNNGYSSKEYEACIQRDQLLMFLSGAGGTGKTRVIDAISLLCSSWYRESAMTKAALTGKAATLIGGRTLASFLLRLKHAIKRREFFELDLLAIDEISMMTKRDGILLDRLLRRYKKLMNILFGGVHIILVGDFLQMPPVGSDSIYIDPSTKRNPSITDIAGFDLWRRFTTGVILEESMRFHSDPEWGEGCRHARLGEWTPAFIRLINSRMVDKFPEFATDERKSAFVTPENATRLSINNAFVRAAANLLPPDRFPIRVVADFKNALNGLSHADVQTIMELPDNRFGRLAPYIDLIPGMPVQVTQNVATGKGVANGTLGTLEYVHFPLGTTFNLARDSQADLVIQVPSSAPDYAILRVQRGDTALSIRPGMSSDLFPVFFNTEAYKESSISLPRTPNGQPRKLVVKIRQLPFVCAAGSTIYKIQGETLESMVVVDWKSNLPIVNKPQQVYLIVSRVTSRDAFLTLTPITEELAAWAHPPVDALKEENRLLQLSANTIAQWQR